MDALSYNKAYLVGIGGIGMSALAQLLHARGVAVSGSDREQSPVTELLREQGIEVTMGHDASLLPDKIDACIYSDAVPFDNPERAHFRSRGVPERSYFEVLGDFTRTMPTIAVAGSHGKTTTTAMLALSLIHAGVEATAVVGSVVREWGSNFRMGTLHGPLVVEACEYNDHVLKLDPRILVVTNLEWDHTDYFKTFDQLLQTFISAVRRLPKQGVLIVDRRTEVGQLLASHAPCTVVDYSAQAVPRVNALGEFNHLNAQAAKAAALAWDASLREATVDTALAHFQGTWRRFEYKGDTPQHAMVYDDYAHHPTEVATTLNAVRKKFPDKKIIVGFHPHLYSRTRDLLDDFARAFSSADVVVVAPIYAAREAPIPGITNELVAERIRAQGVSATAAASLSDTAFLMKKFDGPQSMFITMGAGSIYSIVPGILL